MTGYWRDMCLLCSGFYVHIGFWPLIVFVFSSVSLTGLIRKSLFKLEFRQNQILGFLFLNFPFVFFAICSCRWCVCLILFIVLWPSLISAETSLWWLCKSNWPSLFLVQEKLGKVFKQRKVPFFVLGIKIVKNIYVDPIFEDLVEDSPMCLSEFYVSAITCFESYLGWRDWVEYSWRIIGNSFLFFSFLIFKILKVKFDLCTIYLLKCLKIKVKKLKACCFSFTKVSLYGPGFIFAAICHSLVSLLLNFLCWCLTMKLFQF